MRLPLQIVFDGLSRSEEVVAEAEQQVRRLENICGDLFTCRVSVTGRPCERAPIDSYMVYLNVSLIGEEGLLAAIYHGGDAPSVIRSAFDSVKREITERQRGRISRTDSRP